MDASGIGSVDRGGGNAKFLCFDLVVNLVQDLRPYNDIGKCAKLGHPAASHQPSQHAEIERSVGLAGRDEFIRPRHGGEIS